MNLAVFGPLIRMGRLDCWWDVSLFMRISSMSHFFSVMYFTYIFDKCKKFIL
jgi:hypothetical protein